MNARIPLCSQCCGVGPRSTTVGVHIATIDNTIHSAIGLDQRRLFLESRCTYFVAESPFCKRKALEKDSAALDSLFMNVGVSVVEPGHWSSDPEPT